MQYEIIWSSPYDQGRKTVESAAMASAWVDEFKDKGADGIKVTRNGTLIDSDDLPKFMKEETDAAGGPRDA